MTLFGPYDDYLPVFGYTEINPTNLALLIWFDTDLDLNEISPSTVYDEIIPALENDKANYQCPTCNGWTWDPWPDWKWRSIYMEGRRAENGNSTTINANCWETADYLAKDYEWVQKYQAAFPNGTTAWANKFPHIYLDGGKYYTNGQYNAHCVDDDLSGFNGNAVFKGHGVGRTVTPENKLNSFDVIRLAATPTNPSAPQNYEMAVSNINVGRNLHCVAYLCTDQSGQSWIYEKHNYGDTRTKPYGINILGYDQWTAPVLGIGNYNTSYNSYFKKYDFYKSMYGAGWDENWAGITP